MSNASKCSVYAQLMALVEEFNNDEASDECEACQELNTIRATLLVNYGEGSKHNRQSWSVKDEGPTLKMMLSVLEHLTPKATA